MKSRGKFLKYIFWLIIILLVLLLLLSIVLLCTSFALKPNTTKTTTATTTKGTGKGKALKKQINITDEDITLIQTFLGVALMVQGLLLWVTFRLKRACEKNNHHDIDSGIKCWVLLFVGGWGLGFYAALKFKSKNPKVSLTSLTVQFLINLFAFSVFFYFVHEFGRMTDMLGYYKKEAEAQKENPKSPTPYREEDWKDINYLK